MKILEIRGIVALMDFKEYFQNKDLKKTPRVGIHYEQKTTPDLLWCVARVILDITKDDRGKIFSDSEIRESQVFNSLVQEYFSKPPQENAKKEYDKLSRYQLGVLTYAGVLIQVGERPSKYRINSLEILQEIGSNDLTASKFLGEYTEKFLKDNGLLEVFENYKNTPNDTNHLKAKEAYWEWARINTAIKGSDRKHTYRVFNKIFNVYCHKNRLPGEDASNLTSGPCPYSFLIYNRDNFRDKDKPVGMSRGEYQELALAEVDTEGVVETLIKKAKDAVKLRHGGESEIKEAELGYAPDRVVEVHHILPKHSYSQFSLTRENLIVLTPDQHRSFAHNGSYRSIVPHFQAICLLRKLENIEKSLNDADGFYNYGEFIKIVNECYGWDLDESKTINDLKEMLTGKVVELRRP